MNEVYLNPPFVVFCWCCKETCDTATMRPSYAEMAVRGKERLTENSGERPSSDVSSVSEVCSEAASVWLCEKHGARSPVLDKHKKSSVWHNVSPRRLSGDCTVDENCCVQNTVCHTERHSTVWRRALTSCYQTIPVYSTAGLETKCLPFFEYHMCIQIISFSPIVKYFDC